MAKNSKPITVETARGVIESVGLVVLAGIPDGQHYVALPLEFTVECQDGQHVVNPAPDVVPEFLRYGLFKRLNDKYNSLVKKSGGAKAGEAVNAMIVAIENGTYSPRQRHAFSVESVFVDFVAIQWVANFGGSIAAATKIVKANVDEALDKITDAWVSKFEAANPEATVDYAAKRVAAESTLRAKAQAEYDRQVAATAALTAYDPFAD